MWEFFLAACLCLFAFSGTAMAHFGMVIPSASLVEDKKNAEIEIELSFSPPEEKTGLPVIRFKAYQVFVNARAQDISDSLLPAAIMRQDIWKARHTLHKSGLHQFVVESRPYWEPAERAYIAHSIKTFVAAFGQESGWDKPLGLRSEIVPLTRPFGNMVDEEFRGLVLFEGKPVPNTDVEIEYYTKQDGKYLAPNEYMETQVIRTDAGGVFSYKAPFAGWWGFAAQKLADEIMLVEGKEENVELGAVIWTEFVAPVKK